MTVRHSRPAEQPSRAPRPRPANVPGTPAPLLPPLNTGDQLSRAEFERRYQLHPEIKKAELVEGVVYMPSPTHFEKHSRPHSDIITWLGLYRSATSGVLTGDNATIRLDYDNEVQPDALLRLDAARGGRSHVTPDDYLEGPPELIVEVAASSAAYDLHAKRRVYQRSGVQEYLVLAAYEQETVWFALREGVYEPLAADAVNVLKSEVFPGLWLNTAAMWDGDLAAVLATLQQGLATPEHAAFVGRAGTDA